MCAYKCLHLQTLGKRYIAKNRCSIFKERNFNSGNIFSVMGVDIILLEKLQYSHKL